MILFYSYFHSISSNERNVNQSWNKIKTKKKEEIKGNKGSSNITHCKCAWLVQKTKEKKTFRFSFFNGYIMKIFNKPQETKWRRKKKRMTMKRLFGWWQLHCSKSYNHFAFYSFLEKKILQSLFNLDIYTCLH